MFKKYYHRPFNISDKWISMVIIIFSILFILVMTLHPFNFYFGEVYSNPDYYLVPFEWGKSDIMDVLENVLLFLALGFGFTGYLTKAVKLERLNTLMIIIMSCFAISYFIEFLQLFLPSRYPSLVDILSNSAGGILGFICFIFYECKIVNCNFLLTREKLQINFVGYLIFVILISISLQHFSGISNWDNSYYLIVGNELTQDGPWQGYVSEINIVDRAISETEVEQIYSGKKRYDSMGESLIASYQFTGLGNYHDKRGNLPDLVWRGEVRNIQLGKGVLLGNNNWLETETPAVYLVQRVVETSQFTLDITMATSDTNQMGTARIISLSKDASSRNFTLGQKGSDLVFRLRTSLNIEDEVYANLTIPSFFSDKNPHNLVITYTGSDLFLYVDGARNPHYVNYNPGTILFSNLFYLNKHNMVFFNFVYYAIIFISLGIILVSIVKRMNSHFVVKMLVISGGVLLSSFILEGILISLSGRDLKLENLLISILFMACPVLFLKYVTRC